MVNRLSNSSSFWLLAIALFIDLMVILSKNVSMDIGLIVGTIVVSTYIIASSIDEYGQARIKTALIAADAAKEVQASVLELETMRIKTDLLMAQQVAEGHNVVTSSITSFLERFIPMIFSRIYRSSPSETIAPMPTYMPFGEMPKISEDLPRRLRRF